MVRWPAATEAAIYSQEHPDLSLGLHLDLGEWIYRDEAWVPLYEVVPIDDITAVTDEIFRQLDAFRCLAGKDPTHIDSHQHVHLWKPVRPVLIETAANLAVPLRHCNQQIRYCGVFYGQTAEGFPLPHGISIEGLIETLSMLPPGLTELSCHPGKENDLDTMYRTERAQEVNVLCDPCIRSALAAMGIELCSFNNIAPVFLQFVNL